MNAAFNPFVNRTIITDIDAFHGRTAQLTYITSRLRQMQSTSIVGERRIGKSSLLHYLSHAGLTITDDRFISIYLDLQSARYHTLSGLLQTILLKCGYDSTVIQSSSSTTQNLVAFTDQLLAASERGEKIVLCLDEFENAFKHPNQFGDSFFDHMRSQISRRRFALITATKQSLQELCLKGKLTSPFYNVFTQIELQEWTPEEADSFVEAHRPSVQFTDKELEFIKSPIELHPLKMQVVCDHIIRNRALRLNEQQLRKSIEKEIHTLIVPSTSPKQLHRLQRICRDPRFGVFLASLLRRCFSFLFLS